MKLVPTYKLVALAGLPVLISLGAVFHAQGGLLLGACLLVLFCFALADLLLALQVAPDLKAESTDLLRLTNHSAGSFSLLLSREKARPRSERISVGIEWPYEIEAPNNPQTFLWPRGAARIEVHLDIIPHKRGLYPIRTVFLQSESVFGLWQLHQALPIQTELRVYPPLSISARRMAARFLTSGRSGLSVVRLLGQGREFERLRDYLPGDSYSDIDWKATARRQKPATRLYQAEHTQKVVVAIDAGRLSSRRLGNDPVLDHYINAALFLGQIAQKNGDHFGVLVFSDRVCQFIRPGSGKAHLNTCRELLCQLEETQHSPAYDELFAFLRLQLPKRSLVLVLTDLDDPLLAEKFLAHVTIAIKRHLVHVCMPSPQDQNALFEEPVETVEQMYRNLAGDMMRRELETLRRELAAKGVTLKLADPETYAVALVNQYLEVKQRQLL
jgi:uncharacterized protein (DUF58 family)